MSANTLIVAPSWIGDMVMAQPMLARLKQSGEGRCDVLALSWIAPLLSRMPGVDQVIEMPVGHGRLALGERYRLGRSLRGRYERAIVLPNTLKSALIPWFAAIGVRTGYRGEHRYGLINDMRSLDRSRMPLLVQRYHALAGLRDEPVAEQVSHPVLVPDPQAAESTIRGLGIQHDGRPVAGLCPGAEYGPAKRWPPDAYAELATGLMARGYDVWLFGSANDRAVCAGINQACGQRCTDLSGRTTLDQAIDLMARTSVVITNDSGLMHVACALGIRVVAIFGSTSPDYTPPLSDKACVVRHALDCSPCFARECPLGHTNCLNGIGVEEVMACL